MKNIHLVILGLFLLLPSSLVYCQLSAMDFEQEECGGGIHHLFSELDAGNVIILDFVMLNCAPCIIATDALQALAGPYEVSHPGRVHIYSFGFLNSYSCDQILGWKNANEYTHPVFSNGEEQVNYYGGMGMPTIVIVGNNEHEIFFKSIGYTPALDDKIKEALDSALVYNPTGVDENNPASGFRIYPTLFTDRLTVETVEEISSSKIILYDVFGKQVMVGAIPANGLVSLQVSDLPKGLYIARLKSGQGLSGGIRLIKQ